MEQLKIKEIREYIVNQIDNNRSQLILAYEENDDKTCMAYYEGRIHELKEFDTVLRHWERMES